jgi:hypothetical protein
MSCCMIDVLGRLSFHISEIINCSTLKRLSGCCYSARVVSVEVDGYFSLCPLDMEI